jgi:murein DD-endopeptidase MepM/ murein hydrolase activator NlpD
MVENRRRYRKEAGLLLDRFRKKGQKPAHREYFTIMILPGPNSRVRKFSISKLFIKRAAIVAAVAFVVCAAMFGEYFHMQSKVFELDSLRAETKKQREQLKGFASNLVDMKYQMEKIKELDFKLRKLANMKDDRKEQILGIGGPSEKGSLTLDDFGRKSHDELMEQMGRELDELKSEAANQESSMQKLAEFFERRNSVLAATPSIWPVRGFITSTFGYRRSPASGSRQFHEGLDIANRVGAPVIAPASGTVAEVGYESGYGRYVKIQHGYGMVTLYGHLSKAVVKPGQRVGRGELIGHVGNSGRSTGPHLHYEVRVNGVPRNPRNFI